MSHGHDVHVPNWENGELGTSGAGSCDGRMGSGERVERVAVVKERVERVAVVKERAERVAVVGEW